jgi:hypothetical protein
MCENRLDYYFKKEKGAYKNYASYQGKKMVLNLGGAHQFKNNWFSQAGSQEFQYSFLENLVFNIIIFEKIIKFEYIFS